VSGVAFCANPASSLLVSVSWDKTMRVWDAVASAASLTRETIDLTADALAVCFRPDGLQVAVATLDGHISIFDPMEAKQLATIEGRHDLGSGRSDTDLVTAKTNAQGKVTPKKTSTKLSKNLESTENGHSKRVVLTTQHITSI